MRLTNAMRRAKRPLLAGICAVAISLLAPPAGAADCDTYVPSCGNGLCDCGNCDSAQMARVNACNCGKCGSKPFRLNLKKTVVFRALDSVAGGIEHVLGLDSCGTAGCRCKDGSCGSTCDSGCDSGCAAMPMGTAVPLAAPMQMVPHSLESAAPMPMTPTPAPMIVQPRSAPRQMNRSLPTVPPLDLEMTPRAEMTAPRIVEPQTESMPRTTDSAPPLTPIPRQADPPVETQPLPNATDSIGERQTMPEAEAQPEPPQPDVTQPIPDVQPGLNMPMPNPAETQPRGTQPREIQPRETQPRTRPRINDPNDIFNELPETPTPRPREPRPNTEPREGTIFDMLDDPFGDSARLRRSPTVRPASHGVRSSQRYSPIYPRGRGSMSSAQPIGTGLRPAMSVDELRPVNHLEPVQPPAPSKKRVLAPYRKSRS